MATSNLQRETYRLLLAHFRLYKVRQNLRPDWLTSSNGTRLELDFYLEELAVAIEVQGEQHFQYCEHFHRSLSGFKAQQKRDKQKRAICKNLGVVLYYVFDEASLQHVIELIKDLIRGGRHRIQPVSYKYWNYQIDQLIEKYQLLKNGKNHHLLPGFNFVDKVKRLEAKLIKTMQAYEDSGAACIVAEKAENLATLFTQYHIQAKNKQEKTSRRRRIRNNINSANKRQAELIARDNQNE